MILSRKIKDNISGLKYTMRQGCEPKLFTEIVIELEQNKKIERIGNVNNFIKHLEGFVSDNKGKKYLTKVNYHGQHKDAMVVLDEVSRLMVVTKGDGEFITAYKMSVEQVTQLLNDKFIW